MKNYIKKCTKQLIKNIKMDYYKMYTISSSFFENLKYKNSVPFVLYSNSVKILLLWLLISTIEIVSSVYLLIQYKIHMEDQLQSFKMVSNINSYKENKDNLCIMLQCHSISEKNTIEYSFKYIDFNDDWDIIIKDTLSNNTILYITLDTDDLYLHIQLFHFISTLSLILFFVFALFFTLRKERALALKSLAGNEAILTNKSFILITENIHHELNTPLEVIDNKIEKINNVIQNYLNRKNPQHNKRDIDLELIDLEEDFQFIRQSSEQIYMVLEKTRGFKQLRYSNGNKSIYDIIEGAFKIIGISNTNFSYKIDKELKNYKLNHKLVKDFKNADLLNILLNHLKNSLEANSNKIHVIFNNITKHNLYFSIIDNGSGIPKDMLKRIFSPNSSTKEEYDDSIRGNGLYLNKSILNLSQGDVSLLDTSKYGTTFQLRIVVCLKEKYQHPLS